MKKINSTDSIRQPIVTEKATILSEQNKTVFKVHSGANKKSIKKNIEKLFRVTVVKVNIINTKTKKKLKQGKVSKKPGYKKAIITLKKGQSIDLTTGIKIIQTLYEIYTWDCSS
jgi:large subunit ribosomal protein L23